MKIEHSQNSSQFLNIIAINMNQKQEFKILSIDGGGIRGLYSLYVLNILEKEFCKNNTTLKDYFDMICGTSTGGIIALGITSGYKIEELINLYEKNAETIFPSHNSNSIWSYFLKKYYWIRQLFGSKYSKQPLEKLADDLFQNKKLIDAKNLLCIPSYDTLNGQNIVFKRPHKFFTFLRDQHIPMKDAALATSAAPTYFTSHKVEHLDTTMIDGGIWANNPTLAGIIDGLRFFVDKNDTHYKSYNVLSVGNITNNIAKKNNSFWPQWSMLNIEHLIQTIMYSNELSTSAYATFLSSITGGKIKRLHNASFPSDSNLYLDNSNKTFIKQMKSVAENRIIWEISNDIEISNFFKEKTKIEQYF